MQHEKCLSRSALTVTSVVFVACSIFKQQKLNQRRHIYIPALPKGHQFLGKAETCGK